MGKVKKLFQQNAGVFLAVCLTLVFLIGLSVYVQNSSEKSFISSSSSASFLTGAAVADFEGFQTAELKTIELGISSMVDCWNFQGNQTGCNAQNGKCQWKPKATNPWCMNEVGCCDMLSCFSYDGNKTACEAATLGTTCEWKANDKNQNSWCTVKNIGDWSSSGQVNSVTNIGCCQTSGCWSKDGTNESTCEDTTFLNGICEWHHKNASNSTNYDPYCPNGVGCCVVPPCNNFNGNQTKCNTAESMNFPCNWNSGTSTCGGMGCDGYNNQSESCMDNMCSYNPTTGACTPGGSFVGENGGMQTCWFADQNPGVCLNITGCVYCSNNIGLIALQKGGGNISNNQSFCYNKGNGLCEGHQSDANRNVTGAVGNIENLQNATAFNVNISTSALTCGEVQIKQACDCGPFPACKWTNSSVLIGNFCSKLNRSKTSDEMNVCKPTITIGGVALEVKFCEDPKITNEGNCTLLKTLFNMPCKWDNTSSPAKCAFAYESIFKGGPVGDIWEIDNTNGGEMACKAAKALWKCDQYMDDDGSLKQDCFCEKAALNGGVMIDNCNSNCRACEWFYANGTVVNSSAQGEQACLNSSLGYCHWTNKTTAPNGFGDCSSPDSFKFGGGDCK